MKTPALRYLVGLVAAIALPAFSWAADSFEAGGILKASELLPAESLRGPSHRVRDPVVSDGYLAHITIDTDFGTFEAVGVPQALCRITEAGAIRKLVDTSKSDLFAEGLRRSIEQPIDAVKNVVTHPVDSVKQAPKTVGHFFAKVGTSIGRGVDKIVDGASGGDSSDAGKVAASLGEAAKSATGFDKAKLDTAKQLGVDPYSDNPRLQEEMDKVTWAFFAGGLPLRIGAFAASAGVALAATKMAGIPEDTYALTQAELALRDQQSLTAMGVSAGDIGAFQNQRALGVTLRHRMVLALETLPNARGRDQIVRLASACASPEQAEFLANALAILAERQRAGGADYTAVRVLGRLPGANTSAGGLEIPAPVDHVTWTEEVAAFAQRDDLGDAPKTLVHTGSLSQAAAAGIASAGWKSVAVPYPSR
ncbi:MAG: hypothetical protein KIT22_12875 [Verrucomicrobiae bacterium]|nr:hypothetical protein [Verrucomicrobiae bacterium]